MAMERLWEKMEEEEGKICGRKKKGLREKEEEIPNSVLLRGTEFFFRFSFGVDMGVAARETGQKRVEPKFFFGPPLRLPREPKKNFGSL